jgi:hypothetical protein
MDIKGGCANNLLFIIEIFFVTIFNYVFCMVTFFFIFCDLF